MSTGDVVVALAEGMTFRGTDERGATVLLDAGAEHGGQGRGPSPMKLLLMALGGCTGMDVIAMLRKMRQDVTGYEVRVHGEQREEHPRLFMRIDVEHVVRGRQLDEKAVRRAVELSAARYCPVSAMLSQASAVGHRYRIRSEDGVEQAQGDVGTALTPVPSPNTGRGELPQSVRR